MQHQNQPKRQRAARPLALAFLISVLGVSVSQTHAAQTEKLESEERIVGVFVGIGRYNDPSMPSIPWAAKDVQDLATILTREPALAMKRSDLTVLTDRLATKTRIRRAIRDLPLDPPPKAVMITLVGHGRWFGESPCFLPADALAGSQGKRSLIALDDFARDLANRVGETPVIFLMDMNHTDFEEGKGIGSQIGGALIASGAAKDSWCFIASCEPDQVSYRNGANSAFFQSFIEGLKDRADQEFRGDGNGGISILEAFHFTARSLARHYQDLQSPQAFNLVPPVSTSVLRWLSPIAMNQPEIQITSSPVPLPFDQSAYDSMSASRGAPDPMTLLTHLEELLDRPPSSNSIVVSSEPDSDSEPLHEAEPETEAVVDEPVVEAAQNATPEAEDAEVVAPEAGEAEVVAPEAEDAEVVAPEAGEAEVVAPEAEDAQIGSPEAESAPVATEEAGSAIGIESSGLQSIVRRMTLEQKLDEIFIVYAASSTEYAGGAILYGSQLEKMKEGGSLPEFSTRQQIEDVEILPFYAADQEGGIVDRFHSYGFERLTGPPKVALMGDDEIRDLGRRTARQAHQLGVQMILAPVLDLAPAAEDSSIEVLDRSATTLPMNEVRRRYGSDPEEVVRVVGLYLQGLHAQAAVDGTVLLPVGKHFPGESGPYDSDLARIVETMCDSELDRRSNVFRSLEGQLAGVMMTNNIFDVVGRIEGFRSSWIVERVPSSLIIMTDDLALSRRIRGKGDIPQLAVDAFVAGNHMIMLCDLSYRQPIEVALAAEIGNRPDLMRKLDAAVMRILTTKVRAGLVKDTHRNR